MFAPATGTVLLLTVVHTTLLAAQAASSVVLSRMTWLEEAITVLTSCAPELLVAVEDLDGNLVIGYAAGDDTVIHSFIH